MYYDSKREDSGADVVVKIKKDGKLVEELNLRYDGTSKSSQKIDDQIFEITKSGSVTSTTKISGSVKSFEAAISKITSNKKATRIAAGLMADGGIDDVANVTELVGEIVGYEVSGEESFSELDTLFSEYEAAVKMNGYADFDNTGSGKGRADWEEYFYGKKVKGHSNGQKFAEEWLKDFLK